MKSDLEIARAAQLRPITDVAAGLGLAEEEYDLYGRYKAKIHLSTQETRERAPGAKYVVVTAMTPTPLGEGKTVTSVGLSQGLAHIGKRTIAALRQPSQGPTFGLKGGAAGGGHAQVVPMEDLNLHLTGDIHAVSAAHNQLSAAVDARLFHEAKLNDKRLKRRGLRRLDIDPDAIIWKRVVDVDDRALRSITLKGNGPDTPRESGFDITAASEAMAILALASDLQDLRSRLGRIVVALDRQGNPVTAEDVGAAGAMAVLMKDALMPTLMQTLENTPVLIHAGPFANIAHGNSSIVADRIGLGLLGEGYLVTEAGFGSDCGFEKFSDIKCRYSGLTPDCAVIVATIRALKHHGGLGKDGAEDSEQECLERGLDNLRAHIDIVKQFGVPAVVSVNRFPGDTDAEMARVIEAATEAGAFAARPSEVWARGGAGGAELAEAVVEACDQDSTFELLYDVEAPIRDKIRTIATRIYGAADVEFLPDAERHIDRYTEQGYGQMPVIMAKTPLSLSHDSKLLGRPTGFTLPVRDLRLSAGAGFVYALCGDIMTMPGLPSKPAFLRIDLDENGDVVGLS